MRKVHLKEFLKPGIVGLSLSLYLSPGADVRSDLPPAPAKRSGGAATRSTFLRPRQPKDSYKVDGPGSTWKRADVEGLREAHARERQQARGLDRKLGRQ